VRHLLNSVEKMESYPQKRGKNRWALGGLMKGRGGSKARRLESTQITRLPSLKRRSEKTETSPGKVNARFAGDR